MKKLLAIFTAIAAVSTASAAYSLNWQISSAPTAYAYAVVYANDTDIAATTGGDLPSNVSWLNDTGMDTGASSQVLTDLGSYYGNSYTYTFGLFNDEGTQVAWWAGTALTWANIESYINESSMSHDLTLSLTAVQFTTTPEPTSGLLLLLGVAGLALRRKQR